jgi:hypothetical protein
MILPTKFNVAGTSFRLKEASTVGIGDRLDLVPDPTNKYDPNAIKLLKGELHIGYVPKPHIDEVKAWIVAVAAERKTYACIAEYVWKHHAGVGITAVLLPGAEAEPVPDTVAKPSAS